MQLSSNLLINTAKNRLWTLSIKNIKFSCIDLRKTENIPKMHTAHENNQRIEQLLN